MAAPVSGMMSSPISGPESVRCAFFVERKKRFCKMIVGRGKRFCGEHAAMEDGAGSRRIVCPLDPKHTVSEDKLEKHLKKCNSREKPKPVYYVKDRNCGSGDEAQTAQLSLSEHSRSQLLCLLDKLNAACKGLQHELEEKVLSHAVLQEELDNPKNGDSAHKHLRQQASILAHMEALGLLGGKRCFVEFGAGRGKLSHWIYQAVREELEVQVLLVERSSTRFKVDGKHTDAGAEFERVQVDIQHLDLSQVPLLQDKRLPLVGVGKHLCGAATDLALRCLLTNPSHSKSLEPPPKRLKSNSSAPPLSSCSAQPSSSQPTDRVAVLGLTVALCCHHRCEWRHYVGKDFFTHKGLSAEDFSAFCRMSSWATCGLGVNRSSKPNTQNHKKEQQNEANQRAEEDEHEPAEETDSMNEFLSPAEREHVGRLCKLLIDSGRLHFLHNRGFSAHLTRYAKSEVTLENILLTAVPQTLPTDVQPGVNMQQCENK